LTCPDGADNSNNCYEKCELELVAEIVGDDTEIDSREIGCEDNGKPVVLWSERFDILTEGVDPREHSKQPDQSERYRGKRDQCNRLRERAVGITAGIPVGYQVCREVRRGKRAGNAGKRREDGGYPEPRGSCQLHS
jgi:hypothetical protein